MTESTIPAQCRDTDWTLARDCGLLVAAPGTNAWDAALGRFADGVRAALSQPQSQAQGEAVAWVREGVDGREYCEKPFTTDWTPLYAAPVAAQKTHSERDGTVRASLRAPAASTQKSEPSACQTCHGNGMIGGPSYYAPDEGGVPCPDCTPAPSASPAALTDEARCEAAKLLVEVYLGFPALIVSRASLT
ncbi:hypothetical protein BKK79_20175 [Cupriavidus sp. USMAA2-4]|uniref:hypothetical protein n=1 Tax=Cupriavidus sp. USMAA2-4 TaxID=876364 RepID=UPI0008A67493|nr:hypothetical protein [Cupriavidus sp. USMAA2-4]AOY93862.1 hypothetical protein BKK79_20175 [Cupriavidus sp. USMAA2-4]